MAQKDSGDDAPSLEMPSFGLGRKSRPRKPADPQPEAAGDPRPEPAPLADPGRTEVAPPVEPPRPEAPADEDVEGPEDDEEPGDDTRGPRPARRRPTLPRLAPIPAALVTGAVVGLLMVVLTWGSLHLCEVVRGTSTCGNPGIFLLLAILVVLVLVGGALLAALGVADGRSTSFLGVGLLAVIALLFLADLLFQWWMVLAIPVASIAAFALAQWVTTAFVEPSGPELHR